MLFMVEDIESYFMKIEQEREEERLNFLKEGGDKIRNNNELLYEMTALFIQDRFNIRDDWYDKIPAVVWRVTDYYYEEVNEPLNQWLRKDNSPMIKTVNDFKKIFPELSGLCSNVLDMVELANKLYNLELKVDYDGIDEPEYVYSFNFDFNTFTPINVKKIKELKTEKCVLAKYGHDTSEIDEKLNNFGLTEEQLEMI